jgi:hypothetical protein
LMCFFRHPLTYSIKIMTSWLGSFGGSGNLSSSSLTLAILRSMSSAIFGSLSVYSLAML